MCVHLHHMPAKLTITIPDDVMSDVEAQKPRTLSLASFCALLIDRGLTNATDTQIMGEPAARRASNTSSSNTSNKSLSMSIPAELEPENELIREFWKIKKGSKGQTAWKLLMTELEKIRAKHSLSTVKEQLQLAINGKWQGITLKNFESFSAPRGATAAEPQLKHPAYRDAREIIAEQEARFKHIPSATGGKGVLDF